MRTRPHRLFGVLCLLTLLGGALTACGAASTTPNSTPTYRMTRCGGQNPIQAVDTAARPPAHPAIYASTADGSLSAYSPETGAVLWCDHFAQTHTYSCPASSYCPAPIPTLIGGPLVANGVVYVCVSSYGGDIYALDAANGTLRWRHASDCMIASMAFEDYATPVLASATLYSGSYALNANDGSTRFRLPQYTKPAAVDGGTLYTYTEDIVSAWNANTGVSLWSYKLPDDIGSVPVVANDVLYIGSIGGNSPPAMTPDGLDTFALNARTGNLLWRAATGIASSSPIVVGDTLYVGGFGPALFALDVATGHIRWRHDIGQSNFSTPVALGGTVYFTADGVYAVDAANGTLRWRQPGSADQSSWMDGLAHMNGMLYTSHTSGTSDGALYALSMSTGNTIWHVDGLNQPSPPVAAG